MPQWWWETCHIVKCDTVIKKSKKLTKMIKKRFKMERNLTYHYYYYYLTHTSNPPQVCKPVPRVWVFPGLGSADLDPYPDDPTCHP